MSTARVLSQRLSQRLGLPSKVRKLGSSPRSLVWWADMDGGAVIVKHVVGGGDASARFRREVAALRLADGARPAVVPRLVAVDEDAGIFVLEYLDEGRPAAGWQLDYAAALARLHACGPAAGELPRWDPPDGSDVEDVLFLARRWGVAAPRDAEAELEALVGRSAATDATALLHGDPCPCGNVLYTPEGIRFIDLEQSSVGNGLVELAYLRVGFPTCYSSPATPPGLLREAEDAYRETWAGLTGAPIVGSLADACAAWTIRGDGLVERAHRGRRRYLRKLAAKDWTWGKATARERLAFRLDVTAELAADSAQLAAVSALCRDLRDAMRRRWPSLRVLTDPALNY